MALSKEQILQISDIKTKEIEVPVWNDTVYIRQLTRGQQDEYMQRRFKLAVKQRGREQEIGGDIDIFGHDAWLVAQGVCNENGERLFTDKDAKELEKKNGEAIGTIASEILKFSGMDKDVEELDELKN
jgi:hypothetical protein